ncbi:MAG: hypothetical protein ABIG89_00355 [Candidatus Woesearchaeota archaeon]
MLKQKTKLILTATVFAIFLSSLVYIIPKYSVLWLTMEVIILPAVYILGYEILMDRQRKKLRKDFNILMSQVEFFKKKIYELKLINKYLKSKK